MNGSKINAETINQISRQYKTNPCWSPRDANYRQQERALQGTSINPKHFDDHDCLMTHHKVLFALAMLQLCLHKMIMMHFEACLRSGFCGNHKLWLDVATIVDQAWVLDLARSDTDVVCVGPECSEVGKVLFARLLWWKWWNLSIQNFNSCDD